MAFFKKHISKTTEKEIIENKANSGKIIVITSMRVNNTAGTAFEFSLYLKDPDNELSMLSSDALDAGDYIVDDTVIELPPGYALYDKTDVADTVIVVLNGYEKSN